MKNQPSTDDQFLRIVHQNIKNIPGNENFSIEYLVINSRLIRLLLDRKLIKLTSKSTNYIISEERLLRTRKLLKNDAATNPEMDCKIGFNSPTYRNRVFIEHFKISQGAVRKSASFDSNHQFAGQKQGNQVSSKSKSSNLKHKDLINLLVIIVRCTGLLPVLTLYRLAENSLAALAVNNLTEKPQNTISRRTA